MIRRSDLLHFQETLVDIRSQIADLQRDARQDRLEVQQMFRAIMDRLPPAAGPSAPPPTPRRLRDVLVYLSYPFALHLYFLYPHTVGSARFEFGGVLSCCAHFISYYAVYFDYGLFSFMSLIL
jgi:hypothetical protein